MKADRLWITHVGRSLLLGNGLALEALEDTCVYPGIPNGAFVRESHIGDVVSAIKKAKQEDALLPGELTAIARIEKALLLEDSL